jgi:hypothetical protein
MVRVDQARHDDAAGGVDHLGVVHQEVRADRRDAVAVDQNVAGCEIGNSRVHRDDGAALEEGAAVLLCAHRSSPLWLGEVGRWPYRSGRGLN